MSQYLDIAEKVLFELGKPLTAKSILEIAYINELVPSNLYGTTQHKTLQARLSEDILLLRERSRFCRTAPGLFYLTTMLDNKLGDEPIHTPMIARRRTRDLITEPVLSILKSYYDTKIDEITNWKVSDQIGGLDFSYHQQHDSNLIRVWAMSIVTKLDNVLIYRNGKYRESVSTFQNKKSVGFRTPVYARHHHLFSKDPLGVFDAALEVVNIDLNVTYGSVNTGMEEFDAKKIKTFDFSEENKTTCVFVINIECPEWFEPVGNRLSLNDLEWVPKKAIPNDPDDFDPWSQEVLDSVFN